MKLSAFKKEVVRGSQQPPKKILSFLDKDGQKEVSSWNQNETKKIAHLLSSEFVQWLLQQALEGKWKKEDVANIVFRENAKDQLVLATLDEETLKQVAQFNKERTIKVAHLMRLQADGLRKRL